MTLALLLTAFCLLEQIAFGAESPYRIAFHPELRSYGVAFIKSEVDRFREQEVVSSSFKLLDDDFRAVYTYELEAGERATALELVHLRCKTGGESLPVFLLGTAMMQPDHSEVQRGRILLFNVGSDGKLHMSRAIDVAGMVYAFSQVAQDGFAATVNSRVRSLNRESFRSLMAELSLTTPLLPFVDRSSFSRSTQPSTLSARAQGSCVARSGLRPICRPV